MKITIFVTVFMMLLVAVGNPSVAQQSKSASEEKNGTAVLEDMEETDDYENQREEGLRRIDGTNGVNDIDIDVQIGMDEIVNSIRMATEELEEIEVDLENVELELSRMEIDIPEIDLDIEPVDIEVPEFDVEIEHMDIEVPRNGYDADDRESDNASEWSDESDDDSNNELESVEEEESRNKSKNKVKEKNKEKDKTKGLKKL